MKNKSLESWKMKISEEKKGGGDNFRNAILKTHAGF
jgi:hypothetical protein